MYSCGVHPCGSLAVGGPADQDPTGRRLGLPRRARARQRTARQARDDRVTRRRGARTRRRHDPDRRGDTGDTETGRASRRLRLLHRPDTRPTPGDILARRPPRPRHRTTNETGTPGTRRVPHRSTLKARPRSPCRPSRTTTSAAARRLHPPTPAASCPPRLDRPGDHDTCVYLTVGLDSEPAADAIVHGGTSWTAYPAHSRPTVASDWIRWPPLRPCRRGP